MNGIDELAKLFAERNNPSAYAPMFGTVISLPDVKIRLSDKVILLSGNIISLVNLKETNADGIYINLNKTVALLPYSNYNKFVVLGVVQNG